MSLFNVFTNIIFIIIIVVVVLCEAPNAFVVLSDRANEGILDKKAKWYVNSLWSCILEMIVL